MHRLVHCNVSYISMDFTFLFFFSWCIFQSESFKAQTEFLLDILIHPIFSSKSTFFFNLNFSNAISSQICLPILQNFTFSQILWVHDILLPMFGKKMLFFNLFLEVSRIFDKLELKLGLRNMQWVTKKAFLAVDYSAG